MERNCVTLNTWRGLGIRPKQEEAVKMAPNSIAVATQQSVRSDFTRLTA